MTGSHRHEPGVSGEAVSATSKRDASVPDLVSHLVEEFTTLVRQEVQLAKIELAAELRQASKAGGMFGGAAGAAYMAVLLLSFAAVWGLAEVMPVGLAFLIVGALYALVAAVLAFTGKKTAERIDPVPRQTIQTLEEDAQWAKEQKDTIRRASRSTGT